MREKLGSLEVDLPCLEIEVFRGVLLLVVHTRTFSYLVLSGIETLPSMTWR